MSLQRSWQASFFTIIMRTRRARYILDVDHVTPSAIVWMLFEMRTSFLQCAQDMCAHGKQFALRLCCELPSRTWAVSLSATGATCMRHGQANSFLWLSSSCSTHDDCSSRLCSIMRLRSVLQAWNEIVPQLLPDRSIQDTGCWQRGTLLCSILSAFCAGW